jgi:hypothetical protein
MILKLYRAYKTGKTIYTKLLRPFYEELKKDADEYERQQNLKKKKNNRRNAKHKKPKRRNSGETNS